MIRLTKKFLALSALALAFGSSAADAGVIVTFKEQVGDTYTYEVAVSRDGNRDVAFGTGGDTISISGLGANAFDLSSVVAPGFSSVSFEPTYNGATSTLVFTAQAPGGTVTSGPGTTTVTFSFKALAGTFQSSSGSYTVNYLTETDAATTGLVSGLIVPVFRGSSANAVPEPSTVALAAVGLVGAAFARRKRKA